MKILIIGSGGREHAIAWKISQNAKVDKIYAALGNAGISHLEKGECVDLKTVDEILEFAVKNAVDLTIVGSEELLVEGIVDKFAEKNLKIFGPDKFAAQLEGSKVFSKNFMKKYGVKTAEYMAFSDSSAALEYLSNVDFPVVVKASGLAAGKGVIIAQNKEEAEKAVNEIMVEMKFDSAGCEIVIEEFLEGYEASVLSFTDSETILTMISAKDHKKIGENETGLNTGGMGAICPNPYMTDTVEEAFRKDILEPTLNGIKTEKMDFAGIIFFGVMITKKGTYLLEYNMRLGDPETQAVLPLLESDLLEVIDSCIKKELSKITLEWKNGFSCCVVASSGGYPEEYKKGYEISIDVKDGLVFMAGVTEKEGKFLTSGGRVLSTVGLGDTLEEARKNAYEILKNINFNGKYYRKDIGKI